MQGRGIVGRSTFHRTLTATFAALPVALAAAPAVAQVNVETFRSNLRDQPWFVSLDGNLTGDLGNSQGIVLGTALFAGAKAGHSVIFGKAQWDYAAFSGTVSVSKSFMHVRYNYQIKPWLYWEAFSQIQQDKFQRLAFRNVEGTGPRFSVVHSTTFDLYYGTAYMFEYEELTAEANGPGQPASTISHRWSNYISFTANLDQRTQFTSVLYVQPRFDNFKDVRVLNESGISVKVKTPLSLKLGVVIHHDSQPPRGVKSTDLEAKNSFSVSF